MGEPWAQTEMAGAQVWDKRCLRSLGNICENLAVHAGESFSAACGEAGRQAAHRIFGRETSSVSGLLRGHIQQTAARCQKQEWVLVAQDTTECDYSSHKATTGLGPLGRNGKTRGLLVHTALAMTGAGEVLGVLHQEMWVREAKEHGKAQQRRKRAGAEKESQKWVKGLRGVEAAVGAGPKVLLIQDREGMCLSFWRHLARRGWNCWCGRVKRGGCGW